MNEERFTGVNFCGFKPNKVCMEKLLPCPTFKQHHYNYEVRSLCILTNFFVILIKTAKRLDRKSFHVYGIYMVMMVFAIEYLVLLTEKAREV